MTDRERLIELLSEHHRGNHKEAEMIVDYLLAYGVKIPVRCEECKNFYTESEMEYRGCDGMCRVNSLLVKKADYCPLGERITDNG